MYALFLYYQIHFVKKSHSYDVTPNEMFKSSYGRLVYLFNKNNIL